MRNPAVSRAVKAALAAALLVCIRAAAAQGNYEIQVYGADTVPPKTLMTELHSNYIPEGQKNYIDGALQCRIARRRVLGLHPENARSSCGFPRR